MFFALKVDINYYKSLIINKLIELFMAPKTNNERREIISTFKIIKPC